MNNKVLDCIALTIAIIGAVNWGLIGFFSFDLVAMIFGNMSWISQRIVSAHLLYVCGRQRDPRCREKCGLGKY